MFDGVPLQRLAVELFSPVAHCHPTITDFGSRPSSIADVPPRPVRGLESNTQYAHLTAAQPNILSPARKGTGHCTFYTAASLKENAVNLM